MNRARGTDVNTLLVFMRCIRSYVEMLDGVDNLIAVWDSRLCRGEPNFRRIAAQVDYKGTRDSDTLAGAHEYDEQIQKAIELLGGSNMFPRRMEADDVIAWLCHNHATAENNIHATIVTVDQDMYQLINNNVSVYSPIKKITVNTTNFEQITGVPIKDFLNYKALIGDKSDNINGIPRVGKKTALKIISTGIEQTLSQENLDIFNKNLELMDLSYGYTVHDKETDCYRKQYEHINDTYPNKSEFKRLCIHNAVYNISNDIHNWFRPFEKQEDSQVNVVNLISSLNIGK